MPCMQCQNYIMDTTHFWLFAREYSVWNATVTALQFWTADLEPHILSDAIEWIYAAFFCNHSGQQLWNQPEEIIFGGFMTTLNDVFEWELALEDKGYESGSESLNISTPLCRTLHLYHLSGSENLSSIQLHHLSQYIHIRHTHLNDTEASALYATVWHLAMMITLQQIAAHSMEEQNNLHL